MRTRRLVVSGFLAAVAVTAAAYVVSRRDAARLQAVARWALERAASEGDLGRLLQFAAQTGEEWDLQITECGNSSPLRADGPPYVLLRGPFSPQFEEQKADDATWQFPTIDALAEKLRAEAIKTNCEHALVQFSRRWTAFGFAGRLKGGRMTTVEPIHSRGLFY
jgi:hypothetical protein